MFSKEIKDGYVVGISDGGNIGDQITESEYDEIMTAIHSRPTATSGYTYRLKTDLTWELCELPAEEETEDDEATPEEIEEALEGIL